MDVPILPPAGDSSVVAHLDMGRWLLSKAKAELASDRLQASEKAWGAVAHLIKAIARSRGWRNLTHAELSAAAVLLAGEFERPHLLDYLTLTQAAHSNYYQNNMEVAQIESAMEAAESYLVELNQILREWPREYAIEDEDQQRLLNRVLNRGRKRPFALGTYSLVGFSQLHLAELRETGDREVSVPIPDMDQVRQATLASPCSSRFFGSSSVWWGHNQDTLQADRRLHDQTEAALPSKDAIWCKHLSAKNDQGKQEGPPVLLPLSFLIQQEETITSAGSGASHDPPHLTSFAA